MHRSGDLVGWFAASRCDSAPSPRLMYHRRNFRRTHS
jgi:hypothetical protein